NLPSEAQAQTFTIRNEIDRDLRIDADPEQLYRVVLNLVRNAMQVLSERGNGTVAISARRAAGEVAIDIADHRPGIPETVIPKLFQPFAGSGRPGGSGLGLAISRDLAHAHGGDVTLVTTSSSGTVFRVTIPDRRET